MTDRPTFAALLALSTAVSRNAFAHAADGLDLDPEGRRQSITMQLDTVEEVETAMQAMSTEIGAERAEAIRLDILAGLQRSTVAAIRIAAE